MPTSNENLTEKVQTSYRQLAVAATNLNVVSDALGTVVAELDSALKKLSLGIPCWVYVCGKPSDGPFYNFYQVGYDKVGGKWAIALRRVWGNDQEPERDESEEWAFNDAPRWLRIDAIDKIPDLFVELTKQANETTNRLGSKLSKAKELATAITAVAKQGAPQAK
jgi:hypothetical protein